MWKKALLGVLALVVVLCVVIATRPNTYEVKRSVTMAAPPAVAFANVNDLHRWGAWSPWEKLDPAMKRSFEGPAAGAGAVYGWVGNDKVGEGKLTVTSSKPPEEVDLTLEFIKPFPSKADISVTMKPQGAGSTVEWTMRGEHDFMSKAMCLVVSMDSMIGKDFETGLASLKTVAEAEHQQHEADAKKAAEAAAAARPAAPAEGAAPPAAADAAAASAR